MNNFLDMYPKHYLIKREFLSRDNTVPEIDVKSGERFSLHENVSRWMSLLDGETTLDWRVILTCVSRYDMIGRYLYQSGGEPNGRSHRRQPRVGDDQENDRVKWRAREETVEREGDRSDFPISAADCICIPAQATGSVPTIARLISNCIRPWYPSISHSDLD